MATSVHQSELSLDLQDLGYKLQSFFDGFPICVQCAVRDERLIVLGQHPESASIDPAHILKVLERKIQSFQLDFTQQVRLYLRILGASQPYAHRWFMVQPPPPPPLRMRRNPPCEDAAALTSDADEDDEHWFVEDDELDALIHQLTAIHPLEQPPAIAPPPCPTIEHAPESFLSCGLAIDSPSFATAGNAHNDDDDDDSVVSPSSGNAQALGTESVGGSGCQGTLNPPLINQQEPNTASTQEATALALPDLRTLTRTSIQDGLRQSRSLQTHAQEKIHLLSRNVLRQISSNHTAVLTLNPFRRFDGRMAIATSATVLGMAGAAYTLTRPCAMGACTPLAIAQELSTTSSQILQKTHRWQDLEIAHDKLTQAIELLDPIPVWSRHSDQADQLIATYHDQLTAIETMLDMEALAYTASQTEQDDIYSIAELETVRSLWQDVIHTLESVPSTSDLYPLALQHVGTYRDRLVHIEQRIQTEQDAIRALDNAKQAAQLAQTRQGVARTLENWQFARVTWIVAVERLTSVPRNTVAGTEAQRLLDSYQTSLDAVNSRVQREQQAVRILEQAEQRAQVAQAAEQRLDWQQAVTDWDRAIAYAQQVDTDTYYKLTAEELINHYTNSLDHAQEKLQTTERIHIELEKTCIGEIRICNLISVGQAIKVRLDDGYVDAIDAARNSGNTQLQAVIADHQLILRRTLEQIAQTYQLPVEVYDDENTLLERHNPQNVSSNP